MKLAPSIALLMLCCAGCGSDGTDSDPEPVGSAVLTDAARVLDEATLAALESRGPDGRLVFSEETPLLSQLEPGNVLIIGVSDATPEGALVKVASVVSEADGVTVTTEPAALADAFEELHVQLQTTVSVPSSSQARFQPLGEDVPEEQGISFPLRLEASGDQGNMLLDGSVSIAPKVDLTLDIDFARFRLEELSLAVGARETFIANLTGSGQVSFDESVTLASIGFASITLLVPVPGAGLIPLILTPTLELEAGLRGSISGTVEASVAQEAAFEVGLGYQNGSFGTTSDDDSKFSFEQPSYAAAVNAKALAGPRVQLKIYGLVGPFATTQAFVELNASAEGPPACARGTIDAGLTATAGVELIAEYETTLFNSVYPLASFDSCTPGGGGARPATTWARSYSRQGSPSDRAKAVVPFPDGTYFVAGDSDLFEGVTGFGASVWAMRVDALGNVLWQRAFGGLAEQGRVQGAALVPDGVLVLGNAGIIKLDPGGNPIWTRTFDAGVPLDLASIDARSDGSAVVAGRIGTDTQSFAMGLAASGELQWAKSYGGIDFARVRLTREGGSIAIGQTGSNNGDVFVVKLDAAGNAEWKRAIDNYHDPSAGTNPMPLLVSAGESGLDIAERPSGGYLAVGESYGAFPIPIVASGGYYAAWSAELAADGNVETSRVQRAPNDALYTTAYAVAVRPDGTSLIVGRRADASSNLLASEDVLLIQGGSFTAFGGPGNDAVLSGALAGRATPLQLTPDGGAILAATTTSIAGHEQFWLLKLNRTGNINFPYRSTLPGSTWTNTDAVSAPLASPARDERIETSNFSLPLRSEQTAVRVDQQSP